jgi:hypothetical protein
MKGWPDEGDRSLDLFIDNLTVRYDCDPGGAGGGDQQTRTTVFLQGGNNYNMGQGEFEETVSSISGAFTEGEAVTFSGGGAGTFFHMHPLIATEAHFSVTHPTVLGVGETMTGVSSGETMIVDNADGSTGVGAGTRGYVKSDALRIFGKLNIEIAEECPEAESAPGNARTLVGTTYPLDEQDTDHNGVVDPEQTTFIGVMLSGLFGADLTGLSINCHDEGTSTPWKYDNNDICTWIMFQNFGTNIGPVNATRMQTGLRIDGKLQGSIANGATDWNRYGVVAGVDRNWGGDGFVDPNCRTEHCGGGSAHDQGNIGTTVHQVHIKDWFTEGNGYDLVLDDADRITITNLHSENDFLFFNEVGGGGILFGPVYCNAADEWRMVPEASDCPTGVLSPQPANTKVGQIEIRGGHIGPFPPYQWDQDPSDGFTHGIAVGEGWQNEAEGPSSRLVITDIRMNPAQVNPAATASQITPVADGGTFVDCTSPGIRCEPLYIAPGLTNGPIIDVRGAHYRTFPGVTTNVAYPNILYGEREGLSNILDFGAVADDLIADNNAIFDAIARFSVTKEPIFFPCGDYGISGADFGFFGILVTEPGVHFIGEQKECVRFRPTYESGQESGHTLFSFCQDDDGTDSVPGDFRIYCEDLGDPSPKGPTFEHVTFWGGPDPEEGGRGRDALPATTGTHSIHTSSPSGGWAPDGGDTVTWSIGCSGSGTVEGWFPSRSVLYIEVTSGDLCESTTINDGGENAVESAVDPVLEPSNEEGHGVITFETDGAVFRDVHVSMIGDEGIDLGSKTLNVLVEDMSSDLTPYLPSAGSALNVGGNVHNVSIVRPRLSNPRPRFAALANKLLDINPNQTSDSSNIVITDATLDASDAEAPVLGALISASQKDISGVVWNGGTIRADNMAAPAFAYYCSGSGSGDVTMNGVTIEGNVETTGELSNCSLALNDVNVTATTSQKVGTGLHACLSLASVRTSMTGGSINSCPGEAISVGGGNGSGKFLHLDGVRVDGTNSGVYPATPAGELDPDLLERNTFDFFDTSCPAGFEHVLFENLNVTPAEAVVHSGTATGGTTTTLVDTTEDWEDDQWNGYTVWVRSGTAAGVTKEITATDGTAESITFSATTAPVSGDTYEIGSGSKLIYEGTACDDTADIFTNNRIDLLNAAGTGTIMHAGGDAIRAGNIVQGNTVIEPDDVCIQAVTGATGLDISDNRCVDSGTVKDGGNGIEINNLIRGATVTKNQVCGFADAIEERSTTDENIVAFNHTWGLDCGATGSAIKVGPDGVGAGCTDPGGAIGDNSICKFNIIH